ncbi:uncharacterized protein [Zea mays]|uniref:Uncharacterized protein n=1 Tax=Zea mays TaxID=4577 RepID=B7ZZ88_MAIZE|nr:uncharacterized protein LOC103650771 [Zea mays]ACL53237.1 unknown [Zea mays]|eukprot:XP_008674566.1 uncharacterized protein LOC103650771 [Zea mays]
MGIVRTLDQAVRLGRREPKLTLPVWWFEAVATGPISVRKSGWRTHGCRRVWTKESRLVEGWLATFPFKEFVDTGNFQLQIVDPLLQIGTPHISLGLHEFEGDQAFFTAQRRNIHLLVDGIAALGEGTRISSQCSSTRRSTPAQRPLICSDRRASMRRISSSNLWVIVSDCSIADDRARRGTSGSRSRMTSL